MSARFRPWLGIILESFWCCPQRWSWAAWRWPWASWALTAATCCPADWVLPNGVHKVNGAVVLVVPNVTYRSLCDVMFHLIRQNAEGRTALLIANARKPSATTPPASPPTRSADRADIDARLAHFAVIKAARIAGTVDAAALLGPGA